MNLKTIQTCLFYTFSLSIQSSKILKQLIDSLHRMRPLPHDQPHLYYYIGFKLDYLSEFAPENYHVKGFIPYTDNENSIRFKNMKKNTFSSVHASIKSTSAHHFTDSNTHTLDTGFHQFNFCIEGN